MSLYQTRQRDKRAEHLLLPERSAQEQLMNLLRRNAGASSYRAKDPAYALGESFAQVFDFVGRQSAQVAAGGRVEGTRGTDMLPQIADDRGQFLRRFSEHAFQNGRLAAAILQGQGLMALHACIERAAGRAGLTRTEVRRRIDKTAGKMRIPYTDDFVHFGEDPHAAVALVLSANRAASGALMTIRRAAAQLEGEGNTTLQELFPFLFDGEDRALIDALSRKRRELQKAGATQSAQYRAVSQGLTRAGAVLARKAQMRKDFLTQLDRMLAGARSAEIAFESLKSSQNDHENQFTEDVMTDSEGKNPDNAGNEAGKSAKSAENKTNT